MDLDFTKMQEMQKELQEKYLKKWGGLSPAGGRDHLLWMMAEAGEVADIMKKKAIQKLWKISRYAGILWKNCATC